MDATTELVVLEVQIHDLVQALAGRPADGRPVNPLVAHEQNPLRIQLAELYNARADAWDRRAAERFGRVGDAQGIERLADNARADRALANVQLDMTRVAEILIHPVGAQADPADTDNEEVPGPEKKCLICENVKPDAVELICDHSWCPECRLELFGLALKDETLFPPHCCDAEIPLSTIENFVDAKFLRDFTAKGVEVADKDRTYCRGCSVYLPQASSVERNAECSCGVQTCKTCKGKSHEGDCPEDPGVLEVESLGAEKGWQKCPTCSNMIELAYGCDHITCRCKAEFCYACRAPWKTCECPQWNEDRLIIHQQREREEAAAGAFGEDWNQRLADLERQADELIELQHRLRLIDEAPAPPAARAPDPERSNFNRMPLNQNNPEALDRRMDAWDLAERLEAPPRDDQRADVAEAWADVLHPEHEPDLRPRRANPRPDPSHCNHRTKWKQRQRARRCQECHSYQRAFHLECKRCGYKTCMSCRRELWNRNHTEDQEMAQRAAEMAEHWGEGWGDDGGDVFRVGVRPEPWAVPQGHEQVRW